MRAQSLVEAAISLPVVLLLALGVTDIGRSFYYRESVTNSARQALRIAVSAYQKGTADSICAGTGGGPSAVTVVSSIPPGGGSIATIANQAALESSSDGTPAGSTLAGATITNATSTSEAPGNPGSDSISVTITKRMSVITPLLWPVTGSSFPITVTSSERSEY